ncbi:bifunctional DNA-binding transcriptional regulator/antitoxin component of YhaV-PrlF toxin-antitoxin module [Crossiella equi]|uniref:Bifunctional DNA-binding transcriptional regulator/antitoxin component of YhaV-PrlF toxin-antitoxin module n=1 Tax=Crossiella equi TaxID=130796 RepID=A0ABS5A3N0_9PSEU|nr:AbrB/MazE/SpoVT family DNA-binding domain-containing protein [Crossiella equi]MBP2471186.1 bifunctional DNA-binding transcriptional regulator/antitoxin component of YhaV-PrlF toxin-antitoxin module [Crossiella equi]
MATPLPRPTMYYGMGALDGSGRICNRAALDALGWQAGDRVEVTVRAGSIVVSPSPEGLFEIWGWGARTYVTVPLSARRLLGLAPGDQVLLVASPHHHRLLIHTVPGLDRMLSEQHEHLLGGAS